MYIKAMSLEERKTQYAILYWSSENIANDEEGIGLDTPSIDYGKSKDFTVHQICFVANKLAIENNANLDKLPARGSVLYAIPMLIKDGTGAPTRVFAMLP